MKKRVYITEKPSVAESFANVLNIDISKQDRFRGYAESENAIISWCYGHLVNMAYPDAYSDKYREWKIEHLPIIPDEYIYSVIEDNGIIKQFEVIKKILNRDDIIQIYSCTDSGREGEYIFRLVYEMSRSKKPVKRVWISSYTEESILKGISEAKNITEYDSLSNSAYCRAKEDWLIGMNLSRLYTCKYGYFLSNSLKEKKRGVIAIGRVMTCVLGIISSREIEIKNFKPKIHYGITAEFISNSSNVEYQGLWQPKADEKNIEGEERHIDKKTAEEIIEKLKEKKGKIIKIEKKSSIEKPPLLFNLAELQSEANKKFKISVDRTLDIAQNLYEKKLITYPRTDCRVISTEVAVEIDKILNGLIKNETFKKIIGEIDKKVSYNSISKNKRYVDNSKVTDHYAIVPTYMTVNLKSLDGDTQKIYLMIVMRFLAIFFDDAKYSSLKVETLLGEELFISRLKVLVNSGWKEVYNYSSKTSNDELSSNLFKLRKNEEVKCENLCLDEKTTKPPSRYTDGSLILTMEKAGKFIEDEELREQIKTCGIGTSATRSGIIKKLLNINYISINPKTQVITPTQKGEMIYVMVRNTAKELLNPALTASWEKGLVMIEKNDTSENYFYDKLCKYVNKLVNKVKTSNYKI